MSKAVSLAAFTPTAEEIATARTLLRAADPKMQKSKANSLTQFLAGSKGGAGNAEIMVLKPGEEKSEMIAKSLAYQAAEKRPADTQSRKH